MMYVTKQYQTSLSLLSSLIWLLPCWKNKQTMSLFWCVNKLERTGFLHSGTRLKPISQTPNNCVKCSLTTEPETQTLCWKAGGRQEDGDKKAKEEINEGKTNTRAGRLEWREGESCGLEAGSGHVSAFIHSYASLILSSFTVNRLINFPVKWTRLHELAHFKTQNWEKLIQVKIPGDEKHGKADSFRWCN